jgi:lipoprotein-anchoring transpeptidase ErfK/SrfK
VEVRVNVALVPLVAAAALVAAGCGGGEPVAAEPQVGAVAGATGKVCKNGSFRRLGSAKIAHAAVVRGRAVAYARPGVRPLATFGQLNVNGVPNVFLVRGAVVDRSCKARWYRVQLPMKPNGIEGWVRVRDVEVATVRTRIVVDLSDRRVTLFRDGRPVMRVRAAIGSSATPTPTGSYYVNQRLIPVDPTGPFGPGAIGISAFSEVLTGWAQGGPIAIHGTNRPESIGLAVSNGCVRISNRELRRMFAAARAGTPVILRE